MKRIRRNLIQLSNPVFLEKMHANKIGSYELCQLANGAELCNSTEQNNLCVCMAYEHVK